MKRKGNPGESHGMHKLTEDDVRTMRALRYDGARIADLAERFKVSTRQVYEIVKRRAWSHVE